jgi:hypothetical protein
MAQLSEIDVAKLVNVDLIAAANTRLSSAVEKLRLAEVAFDLAAVAHSAAQDAATKAAAGVGEITPEDAEIQIETTARTVKVAGRVLEAATRERAAAHGDELPARGRAHREVYKAGIALRLAAARRADEAHALLAAAQAAYDKGTAYIARARQNGCNDLWGNPGPRDLLTDYAAELKQWTGRTDWSGKPLEIVPVPA